MAGRRRARGRVESEFENRVILNVLAMKTDLLLTFLLGLGMACGALAAPEAVTVVVAGDNQPASGSVLVFRSALGAAAAPNAPQVFRHQTKVVDGNGQPLPGAVVELYRLADGRPDGELNPRLQDRFTADDTGTVKFTLTNRTPYTLVASKTGLSLGWVTGYPQANQEGITSEIALTAPATVSGTVNDAGGKPVPDAEVWVSVATRQLKRRNGFRGWSPYYTLPGRFHMATRTTADGRFRIESVPADASLDLAASKPGLALEQTSSSRMGNSFKYKSGESNIVLTLKPAGAVEGVVVEEDTGKPLPGARVLLASPGFGGGQQASALTGTDGVFRLADLGEGEWNLRAMVGTNEFSDWVCEPAAASVTPLATNRNVKITASRGGVIEVSVRGADGQVLKETQVSASAQNVGQSAQTSDLGIARLRLAPGDYSLFVQQAGWRVFQSQATCDKGQTNRQEVVLEPAPRIAGVVLDPAGKPAPKITVALFPNSDGETLTDDQGRFSLTSDPNRFGGMGDMQSVIIARDIAHNLAATLEGEENNTNLSVRLEPGLTLVGRVTDTNGKAVTNAEFYVMFHTERMGSSLGSPVAAGADGRFEVKGLPAGRHYSLTVMANGYGTENRDLGTADPAARTMELDPFQLPVANLRLAGVVVDEEDKPAAGVMIYSHGAGQPNVNGQTDSKGRFSFDQVCAGTINLSAHSPSGRGQGSIVAEGGDTNITLKLGAMQPMVGMGRANAKSKLTGTIVDPEGKPAPKVLVSLFPFYEGEKKTDDEGRFTLTSDPNRFGGMQDFQRVVIARDPLRNLAVAFDLEADATNADLKLEPAWTLAGKVVTTNGVAIPRAQAFAMLKTDRMTAHFGAPTPADAQGRFEIKALPPGRSYQVQISAQGFGQDTRTVDTLEGDTRRVELEPVQLLAADQRIAGVVVDPDDKPVGGAWINSYGNKQPNFNGQTDSKGRFLFKQVCAGPIQLSVNSQNGLFANPTVEGGDTNITIRIATPAGIRAPAAPPASLEGKSLPDLTPTGLTAEDAPANQRVLAVLIDAEQRPSRRVLKRLTELAGMLKEKGVAVVVLQAGALEGEAFAAWKQEAALPFPVGLLKGNRDKTRAAWGAAALPWLVLTDTHRKVTDEGFAPGELEEKLNPADK